MREQAKADKFYDEQEKRAERAAAGARAAEMEAKVKARERQRQQELIDAEFRLKQAKLVEAFDLEQDLGSDEEEVQKLPNFQVHGQPQPSFAPTMDPPWAPDAATPPDKVSSPPVVPSKVAKKGPCNKEANVRVFAPGGRSKFIYWGNVEFMEEMAFPHLFPNGTVPSQIIAF